jgi:hypothetical protein
VFTRIYQGLAWLVVGGLLVQIYLAGAGLFGATTFQPHRALGNALAVAILLLLIVVLIARPGWRAVGPALALVVLTIVQVMLPSLRTGLPWVAALHALNAVALVAVTVSIALAPRQAVNAGVSPESLRIPAETG